jgi:hypothetical protein
LNSTATVPPARRGAGPAATDHRPALSQHYVCDQATGRWTFRDPTAALNRHGRAIGVHYAGPTWELFDGSRVKAAVQVNLPAPNPTADIPWLLLQATEHAGSGVLSTVD